MARASFLDQFYIT